MLLLTNAAGTAPDKIQLTTSAAVTVDVHASYVDASNANPPVVQGDTMGRQNTAITTATTTDIIAAPASNEIRNVKTIHIRNKHASTSVDVTVIYNQNGTDFELHKATLLPGEALEYVEGIGFFTLESAATAVVGTNKLTGADQALGTSDTYMNNSALPLAGLGTPTIGRAFHWRFIVSKTNVGTATPIIQVRTGTAGTTSDTSRITFTWGAGTAAADRAEVEIDVLFVADGATAVLRGKANATTNLTTTGWSNAVKALQPADSAAFDATVANLLIGLSYNAGASGAHTLEYLSAFTDDF